MKSTLKSGFGPVSSRKSDRARPDLPEKSGFGADKSLVWRQNRVCGLKIAFWALKSRVGRQNLVFGIKPPACVLIPTRSAHCVTGPPLRAPENCLPRLFHGGLVVVVLAHQIQIPRFAWELSSCRITQVSHLVVSSSLWPSTC